MSDEAVLARIDISQREKDQKALPAPSTDTVQ